MRTSDIVFGRRDESVGGDPEPTSRRQTKARERIAGRVVQGMNTPTPKKFARFLRVQL